MVWSPRTATVVHRILPRVSNTEESKSPNSHHQNSRANLPNLPNLPNSKQQQQQQQQQQHAMEDNNNDDDVDMEKEGLHRNTNRTEAIKSPNLLSYGGYEAPPEAKIT